MTAFSGKDLIHHATRATPPFGFPRVLPRFVGFPEGFRRVVMHVDEFSVVWVRGQYLTFEITPGVVRDTWMPMLLRTVVARGDWPVPLKIDYETRWAAAIAAVLDTPADPPPKPRRRVRTV